MYLDFTIVVKADTRPGSTCCVLSRDQTRPRRPDLMRMVDRMLATRIGSDAARSAIEELRAVWRV